MKLKDLVINGRGASVQADTNKQNFTLRFISADEED